METTRKRKMSVLFLAAAAASLVSSYFIAEGSLQPSADNDITRELRQKLSAFTGRLPEDRVYLHTDKPFYEPGDDIWFSAYVRDGATLKPSSKSDIVHIELINPKGGVEKHLRLVAKNGKAAGDLHLDDEAAGGLYKIKAYTSWMKNDDAHVAFEKELQVQDVVLPHLKMKLEFEKKAFGPGDEVIARLELATNENEPLANHALRVVTSLNGTKFSELKETTGADGIKLLKFRLPEKLEHNDGLLNVVIDYQGSAESISRSIPIVLNKIKVDLFPEGGELIEGQTSSVAFRALNEFGKPADIEGIVVTSAGSRVASFKSFHQGMGSFVFNPQPGERYYVKVTKPLNIKETYLVPQALERGYTMEVSQPTTGVVGVNVITTESEELSLVAQVRGKIYYSTVIRSVPGANKFSFSTRDFPIGVGQLTLFDSKGIARSERLAFINKHKQMFVSVQPEKEKYLPREKVRLNVTVKDERGMPMPANLSMAVVNDQLLSFADNKSGHILSQLLLEQDLREKIEEPAFYFDPKQAKADQALDLVMMTSGWRRFTWEKIMNSEPLQINFPSERAIIGGVVYDANTSQPLVNARIKQAGGAEFITDASGRFVIAHADLSKPVSLSVSADGFHTQNLAVRSYQQNLNVWLYSGNNMYGSNSKFNRFRDGAGMAEDAQNMPMAAEIAVAEMAAPAGKARPDAIQKARVEGVKKEAAMKDKKAEEKVAVHKGEAKRKVMARHGGPRLNRALAGDMEMLDENFKAGEEVITYYRARQFASPAYHKTEKVEERTDFRNTIYWNPALEVGHSGKKTVEFYASDDITSFRVITEGVGYDGGIGRNERNFFTQLPFGLLTKIPVELATEDLVSIPVTMINNTDEPLGGLLRVGAPEGLVAVGKTDSVQTIMPGQSKTVFLNYRVSEKTGTGEIAVSFNSCGMSDGVKQQIRMVPKGFPQQVAFSAQEVEREYTFETSKVVNGSLKATFTAFPNVVSDLMKGVEGILQEPYGCFEQTSCTAYPNAMVLGYLKHTGKEDSKLLARATDLLDRGYKRLTTFETKSKGYEWFGSTPAHEGLTAYGIMEFVDMKNAGQEIDQQMLDRTVQWLLSHKDGKGGFERERRALHDFGRISDDVLNGYIVYALAEAGYTDFKKEFETAHEKALSSGDAYLLALSANAAYALKENAKGAQALKKLLALQKNDGSFTGASHSITYSQGSSLSIETSALATMALLKSPETAGRELNRTVQFLVSSRSGSGVFSSTQGTILALKALTQYAQFSKKAVEDGTIIVYIDGKKVAERSYKAGDKGEVSMAGLEAFVKGEGKHTVKIKYTGVEKPLPYTMAINWNTTVPKSDKECVLDLQTKIFPSTLRVGETARLSVKVINRSGSDIPSAMALVGIPAGFTAQPWQLKELQEKGLFDYYEIKGNNIALYYRGMAASDVKDIGLDLKAEMPGEYDAPASSAYLYYTNEYKTWTAGPRTIIKQ